ncbi:ABC transporter permease [Methyloterricola oryzae]|uniref:ABC transporter permease n=1 Tax=Methyloterricola oryzae TaxID=1495050 RepID=UPI0005EACF65|nr:ABC transporter permease [Methyloterricola oryzae]
MRHDFYLAWRYLRHHTGRTWILVICLSLIGSLPMALHSLMDAGERQMLARAESTPLLIGARGSAVDLTLAALYFNTVPPPATRMAEVERIADSGWADPLPIYARFRIQGHPLVGVTLDYLEFRGLEPQQGRTFALLGECVIGADAAAALHLKPGDNLLTTPENMLDLAGVYPLKLHVAGILARNHSPDDAAVFIDLQTAWIIEGLGHGHEAQATAGSPSNVVADPRLVTYTEITPENVESFHFHGDPLTYPISAVIALPHDRRAATLLQGRYLSPDDPAQIVQPPQIAQGLLQNVFKVGDLLDAVLLWVGSAALLAVGLVFTLSLRLRERELHTIFLMGCSRSTVARLVAAECILLAGFAGLICLALVQLVRTYAEPLVQHLVIS